MEDTSNVLIEIFRNNSCPHILIMCGKRGVYSDKEHLDKEKGSDITIRESGCAG
jgi:hypothetical protein